MLKPSTKDKQEIQANRKFSGQTDKELIKITKFF